MKEDIVSLDELFNDHKKLQKRMDAFSKTMESLHNVMDNLIEQKANPHILILMPKPSIASSPYTHHNALTFEPSDNSISKKLDRKPKLKGKKE